MKKFNDWFGNLLTDGLSTMQMFYIVSIIVLFPLLIQRPHTLIGWIQYITQAFFQGATLPLLAYTSKKESAKAKREGEKTNKKLDDIHEWMKESHDRIHEKLDKQVKP